jgi:hypothetical protein
MNLKQALMELGNRLVTERGYLSAPQRMPSKSDKISEGIVVEASMLVLVRPKSTEMIARFTEWLNENPDAREILQEMGVEWPV